MGTSSRSGTVATGGGAGRCLRVRFFPHAKLNKINPTRHAAVADLPVALNQFISSASIVRAVPPDQKQ